MLLVVLVGPDDVARRLQYQGYYVDVFTAGNVWGLKVGILRIMINQ
jgi:hypothetical protein